MAVVFVVAVELLAVEEEELDGAVGREGLLEEVEPLLAVCVGGGGDGDVWAEVVVGELPRAPSWGEGVERDAAGEGLFVLGVLDVEVAVGDGCAAEGYGAGVAPMLGDDDVVGLAEEECVGRGGDGECPDDVGGDVVDVGPGGGLLEGECGVGWDGEGGAVDGDG